MHEVGRGEKMEALWYHSEKLALVFGLVVRAAPPGKALRIVKDLRILTECKASASNLRRMQDKDIVKEVEDYLKTYSSTEMDISWRAS
ncbi:hypothetical protein Tco_1541237 [Tanacetum coccineum]